MVRDFSVRSSNEPNWRTTLDTQQLIDVAYKCFSFDDHYMWHSLTPNAIQMVLVASASALAALTNIPATILAVVFYEFVLADSSRGALQSCGTS